MLQSLSRGFGRIHEKSIEFFEKRNNADGGCFGRRRFFVYNTSYQGTHKRDRLAYTRNPLYDALRTRGF
jgi:hypothetical protein